MSETGASNNVSGPPPITIAKQFIKQYYPILTLSPQKLQHFYHPTDSYLSYTIRPEDCEGANAGGSGKQGRLFDDARTAGIWNFCRGAKMDLASGFIDAQKTHDGGVIIVIYGEMTLRNDWAAERPGETEGETDLAVANNGFDYESFQRKFIHTFVLARGSGAKKNLYVSNDIFRFVDLEQKEEEAPEEEVVAELMAPSEEEAAEVEEAPVAAVLAAVLPDPPVLSTPTNAVVEVDPAPEITEDEIEDPDEPEVEDAIEGEPEAEPPTEEDAEPVMEEQETAVTEDVPPVAPREQIVVELENAVAAPAPPSSWASLVAGSKSAWGAKPVEDGSVTKPKPAIEAKPAAAPTTEKASDAKKASNVRTKIPTSSSVSNKAGPSSQKREGKQGIPAGHSNVATSVYIRNVPVGTKEEHLSQLFIKLFPGQKIVHVAVYASRGFAFVEFANKDCVENVLGGSTIKKLECPWQEDVVLEIEGKKTERHHANSNNSNAHKSNSNAGGAGGNRFKGGPKQYREESGEDGNKGRSGSRGRFENKRKD
jgi:hypothetical protein